MLLILVHTYYTTYLSICQALRLHTIYVVYIGYSYRDLTQIFHVGQPTALSFPKGYSDVACVMVPSVPFEKFIRPLTNQRRPERNQDMVQMADEMREHAEQQLAQRAARLSSASLARRWGQPGDDRQAEGYTPRRYGKCTCGSTGRPPYRSSKWRCGPVE